MFDFLFDGQAVVLVAVQVERETEGNGGAERILFMSRLGSAPDGGMPWAWACP
jgi:hypothetical protein